MKKQIALLVTIAVASGLSAFGQDYLEFDQGGVKVVWDESTTPGVGTIGDTSGLYDVAFLWAPSGTADTLPSLGTEISSNAPVGPLNGINGVSTNEVFTTGSGMSALQTMLSTGGWNVGELFGGSTIVESAMGTKGSMVGYGSPSVFELAGTSGNNSGQSIEMIYIAWNASSGITTGSGSTTFSTVSAFGWSNPFNSEVGSSAGDPNASAQLDVEDFGVAPVPEPTTLALAGLGGLSMLFLRRRKA